MAKVYTIISNRRNYGRADSTSEFSGTMPELVYDFKYTLDCGASWEHEKGNSKINTNPKTIKSLISNLNKAERNSAADGNPRNYYELKIEG